MWPHKKDQGVDDGRWMKWKAENEVYSKYNVIEFMKWNIEMLGVRFIKI